MIELVPIKEKLEDNHEFLSHPDCNEYLELSVRYHASLGYSVPWIGYYARLNGELVGSAAFKGRPVNGKVEIAYGTFPSFQHRGIGAMICRALVELSKNTDDTVLITARTLPEENFSVKILRKNNFHFAGIVQDPDDGEVWEWYHEDLD